MRNNYTEIIERMQSRGDAAIDLLIQVEEEAVTFARDPDAVRAALRASLVATKIARAAASRANKIKGTYTKVLEKHGMRPLVEITADGAQSWMNVDGEPANLSTELLRAGESLKERWGTDRLENLEELSSKAWWQIQSFLDDRYNHGLTGIWTPWTVAALRITPEDLEPLAAQLQDDDTVDLEWLLVSAYEEREAEPVAS